MGDSSTVDKSMEETIASLSEWFCRVCKFLPALAAQLSSELVLQSGITEVEQFSMIQQIDPNWLDSLKCPLPTLAKILVKANVEKIGRTPLRHLDLEDVRGVVDACLPEFPYGAIFKEKKISGFTLSCIDKIDALVDFGVTNSTHAMPLFASIMEWKRIGVPNELIAENTLRNVHIKEEVFREVSVSKIGSEGANAASSTDTSRNNAARLAEDEAKVLKKVTSSYVGMGTENNPVCFSDSDDSGSEEAMDVEDDEHLQHTAHSAHSEHTAHSAAPTTAQLSVQQDSNESYVAMVTAEADFNVVDTGFTSESVQLEVNEEENVDDEHLRSTHEMDSGDFPKPADKPNMNRSVCKRTIPEETEESSKRVKRVQTPCRRVEFPGIPNRPEYLPIIHAIEATRLGKVIRMRKEHIDLLRTAPRELISGHWEYQDMSFQSSHGLSRGQTKQNKLREKALVFIPVSRRRKDAMVSPGRELIFVESDKKCSNTNWRTADQKNAAASSGDSSNEEDHSSTEKLYGCRVRPGNPIATAPYDALRRENYLSEDLYAYPVTQFLSDEDGVDEVYTRPFPGIPFRNGTSPAKYADIIEAIEASRAGKLIRMSKENIDILLNTPCGEIDGRWVFENRWPLPDDCELSLTLKRQSLLLKKALVFKPLHLPAHGPRNSISPDEGAPRELVIVESNKKPSRPRADEDEQSATSGDSEAEEEDGRRVYGTAVPKADGACHSAIPLNGVPLNSNPNPAANRASSESRTKPTYAEHFNNGPYPGLPAHEELQEQYAGIFRKLEATRVGDPVFLSEEEIAMLLTLPEEAVGGMWVRTDRSRTSTNGQPEHTVDGAANTLRANALVFIPSSTWQGDVPEVEILILQNRTEGSEDFPSFNDLQTLSTTADKPPTAPRTKQVVKKTSTTTPKSSSGNGTKDKQPTPLVSAAITGNYGDHYQDRPFAGIPQHPLLKTQYEDIVERIRATKVGDAVLVTENQIDMLRAVPEALIGGQWVQQDTSYYLGRVDSLQGNKDMERRTKSLVFLPKGVVASVVPYLQRTNPATVDNIVVVTSAPKKVKTNRLEEVTPAPPKKKPPAKSAVTKPALAKKIVPMRKPPLTKQQPELIHIDSSDSDGDAGDSDYGQSSNSSARSSAHSASAYSSSARTSKRSATSSTEEREDDEIMSDITQGGRSRRNTVGTRDSLSMSSTSSWQDTSTTTSHPTIRSFETQSISTISTAPKEKAAAAAQSHQKALRKACHDALHSRDDKVLKETVKYLGEATAKSGRYAVDYMVSSGTFHRLLHFIHVAPQLAPAKLMFVYFVLKTVTLIVSRADGLPEIEIIFNNNRFTDILVQCTSTNAYVREQAIHLVGEIGVSEENNLKQNVLAAGAVKAVVDGYIDVGCFAKSVKTRMAIQGQCVRCLYKLTSLSTPRQFHYFVPALAVLRDALTSDAVACEFVIEATQAVNFLVVANNPRQIDVLMENNFFDILVEILRDKTKSPGLRWHASIPIWSVVKLCNDPQMRKLSRLLGILGRVFHTEPSHPHLCAAALNIIQVMLLRGDYIVQQFVYHRDALPSHAMDLVRGHSHQRLVHGNSRNSNSMVKYASFTVAHATVSANSEQLIRLLELGVYPVLFKVVSFEGEDDNPEEAKLKAVAALCHLLQKVPNEMRHWQQREEFKSGKSFSANWDLIKGLVNDRYDESDDEGSRGDSSSKVAEEEEEAEFVWSAELREKAQELIDLAHEVELL